MLKKAQLDFGMVGAGAIAQSYSQSFTMTDRANLLAVCDIREDAAEAVAGALSSQQLHEHRRNAKSRNAGCRHRLHSARHAP